ncbi:MAG TPA: RluA family pseudouridine synthase [Chthoniobacterales bacterium]
MTDEHLNFSVNTETAGRRLDLVVVAYAPHLSRSRAQALIEDGHIRVNGETVKQRHKLREGDTITVNEPSPIPSEVAAEEIPLTILFEDEHLLVLNKPPGMVVHPGAGNQSGTLVNALLHHCNELSGIGGVERPGIVHRLDKDTSGCLVVAKNDAAHRALSTQFAERETTTKRYLAIARGVPRVPRGKIDAPIVRHPVDRKKMAVAAPGKGRSAQTLYGVISTFQHATGLCALIECRLLTGRTHQIRVHLKHLGHPLAGDAVYGRGGDGFPRQMLHAWKLGFHHPVTGLPVEFCADIPPDFARLPLDFTQYEPV